MHLHLKLKPQTVQAGSVGPWMGASATLAKKGELWPGMPMVAAAVGRQLHQQ